MEILVKASEDLETFAASVQSIALNEPSVSLPSVHDRKGNLNLPVRGKVLRKFNEADAALIIEKKGNTIFHLFCAEKELPYFIFVFLCIALIVVITFLSLLFS